jgi:hypothetical protein
VKRRLITAVCSALATLPLTFLMAPPVEAAQPAAVSTIYYSPYNEDHPEWKLQGASQTETKYRHQWQSDRTCGTDKAAIGVPDSVHQLAGWSVARLAPAYYLAEAQAAPLPQQPDPRLKQMNQLFWIDPGSGGEFNGACDVRQLQVGPIFRKTPAQVITDWMITNTAAKWIILAGPLTAENSHQGIQEVYFNTVRDTQDRTGVDLRSRILVCNYKNVRLQPPASTSHEQMFLDASKYVGTQLDDCPALEHADSDGSWHP